MHYVTLSEIHEFLHLYCGKCDRVTPHEHQRLRRNDNYIEFSYLCLTEGCGSSRELFVRNEPSVEERVEDA